MLCAVSAQFHMKLATLPQCKSTYTFVNIDFCVVRGLICHEIPYEGTDWTKDYL